MSQDTGPELWQSGEQATRERIDLEMGPRSARSSTELEEHELDVLFKGLSVKPQRKALDTLHSNAVLILSSLLFLATSLLIIRLVHPNRCPYIPRVVSSPSPLSTHVTSSTYLAPPLALPDGVGNNLHLTYDQCDIAFPKFWEQTKWTREWFEGRGGVRKEDVERAANEDGTRVAIVNGNLYVKDFHPEYMTRVQAVLASLYEAITSANEPIPDVEFYFRAKDTGEPGAHFELDTRYSQQYQGWLAPDFGFFSWPEPVLTSYKGVIREIEALELSQSWSQKMPKLFWRGAMLSPSRESLYSIAAKEPWGDVAGIEWGSSNSGRTSMWDHCRHQFLAQVEGRDSYSGRMKYLLNCRSVVVAHRLEWNQHFHAALDSDPNSENQNMVMLSDHSWDTLPATMEALLADPARAERVADNAWRTLHGRYLTPAATSCYWRRVLREYASVQQFVPAIEHGTDYESFVLMGRTSWEPHR